MNRKIDMLEGYSLKNRLNTLSEIILQIDSITSKDEIFKLIRSETKWLIDYEVLFLALLNPVPNHYQIITLSPIADASGLNYNYYNIEEGIPGWVIRNQSPVINSLADGSGRSNALDGKYEELGITSILAVPINSGQNKIGALVFGSINQNNYTDDDLLIAQLFGIQVATVIKNVSFFEEAKKRITQIEVLNEISRTLNSTLDIEALLDLTVKAIRDNFNYFDVMILMFTNDKSELVVKSHAGDCESSTLLGMRQKVGHGLIGWVAKTGEYTLANDVTQDPLYISYGCNKTKSELVLPIKIAGEVVGILNIEDSKLFAFDDMDVIVLQTLCDHISSALNNAQLFKDVTEANLRLKDLDNLKTEFLSVVSHDFRSPLSNIIMLAKKLLKENTNQTPANYKEYLSLIVDQANRLNTLAEDTLSLTQIELGQISIEYKVVNVAQVIEDAISAVRFSNRYKIEYSIEPSVSFIKCDGVKLRQVLQNLLSNSIKYTPAGGMISVEVCPRSDNEVLFSVTDKGIGIKSEDFDKLFKKFSRIEVGEAVKVKGSGLGLWICKKIVEAHGGIIWVESEYGNGSTFKFTIQKAID